MARCQDLTWYQTSSGTNTVMQYIRYPITQIEQKEKSNNLNICIINATENNAQHIFKDAQTPNLLNSFAQPINITILPMDSNRKYY
jgi:membrane-anchored protein YejM (alkaline phosphatase superfamily)